MEVENEVQNTQNDQNKSKTLSGDEKAPDSSDNSTSKNRAGFSKGKKRKKPKDSTAPRQPLTGYVRYLNERRESVRAANPNLPFAEITKLLASEWSSLPSERKQQYLDAAEQDRERYAREFNAYKQTEAYKLFTAQTAANAQHDKKLKEENKTNSTTGTTQTVTQREEPRPPIRSGPISDKDGDLTNFDIPIFTEEFLDHNKTREAELRQLRKSNTDYEQQNSILQKHIENMRTAISKLESETSAQRTNNLALQQHLDQLRATLASSFANVRLPGTKETATLQSIDSYMASLHVLLLENNNNTLLQQVRDIVSRLEFTG